jgi:hypothetical protein
MSEVPRVLWLPEPEEKDYPAALSYLTLIHKRGQAKVLVRKLKKAEVQKFKAKDIFRASGLSLLGVSNFHVQRDVRKIRRHLALSPLLLVRDPLGGKLVIADGYHRLCAVYSFREDEWIPCKIV